MRPADRTRDQARIGCKIFVEDIYAELERHVRGGKLDDLPAFLARRLGDVLYIDVQVVEEPNPRLRSLAAVCQLHHGAQRVASGGPIRWIHFRSGQSEHRQTANLALRMGGRELATQHVFARRLRD